MSISINEKFKMYPIVRVSIKNFIDSALLEFPPCGYLVLTFK